MSGNVWEWTNSWYDEKRVYRSVRGGSLVFYRDVVRCADRVRSISDHFHNGCGFRVVSPDG